jgi:methionine aminopeptidase
MHLRAQSVEIKSPREIAIMREVGRLAADTLAKVGALIRPGISTQDIDDFVHADTLAKGARRRRSTTEAFRAASAPRATR